MVDVSDAFLEAFPELAGYRDALLERLFAPLDRDAAQELAAAFEIRHFRRGDILVDEQTVPGHVGFLLRGAVGLKLGLSEGRAQTVGIMLPTDRFGPLFDGPSDFAIEALTDVDALLIAREPLERALAGTPELERLFLTQLLDEIDAAREWVALLSGTKVIERVASFLLVLARRKLRDMGRSIISSQPVTVNFELDRSQIAELLGIRQESLSRALHTLQARGLIRLDDLRKAVLRRPVDLLKVSGNAIFASDYEG